MKKEARWRIAHQKSSPQSRSAWLFHPTERANMYVYMLYVAQATAMRPLLHKPIRDTSSCHRPDGRQDAREKTRTRRYVLAARYTWMSLVSIDKNAEQ